jgi:hypothetical protein
MLSMSKITRSFLTVGLVAPCVLQAFFYFGILRVERMPEWLFIVLWPGFGFYMASDGGSDLAGLLGFLMSVVANGLAYLLVGSLISLFYGRVLKRRTPTEA